MVKKKAEIYISLRHTINGTQNRNLGSCRCLYFYTPNPAQQTSLVKHRKLHFGVRKGLSSTSLPFIQPVEAYKFHILVSRCNDSFVIFRAVAMLQFPIFLRALYNFQITMTYPSAVPTSQVRRSAIFVQMTTGILKIERCDGLEWDGVNRVFHKNASICVRVGWC
jgi:hypothetical protein